MSGMTAMPNVDGSAITVIDWRGERDYTPESVEADELLSRSDKRFLRELFEGLAAEGTGQCRISK